MISQLRHAKYPHGQKLFSQRRLMRLLTKVDPIAHPNTQQMSSPIQFYRSFQALMQEHDIRHVLTLDMACCEYDIQQPTKDTDWIIHPDDLGKLRDLLHQCEQGLTGKSCRISYRSLFGAPFLEGYHRGGWTTHIAIHDEANSPEHHLDFFGKAPRVRLEDVFHGSSEGLAGRGIIAQVKKRIVIKIGQWLRLLHGKWRTIGMLYCTFALQSE